MAQLEKFNFDVSAYCVWAGGGAMTTGTDPDVQLATGVFNVHNPANGDMFVEPAHNLAQGNPIVLDSVPRIVIAAWKDSAVGGAGPVCRVALWRSSDAAGEFVVELGAIAGESDAKIVTAMLPPSFGKSAGAPNIVNTMRMSLRADEDGTAHVISVFVMLVPGNRTSGASANRGNMLSGPAFY
jgi:hypothetical protein